MKKGGNALFICKLPKIKVLERKTGRKFDTTVYGWEDQEMKKAPICAVNTQNFEIFEGKVTNLIANRPWLLSSQTLSVNYE